MLLTLRSAVQHIDKSVFTLLGVEKSIPSKMKFTVDTRRFIKTHINPTHINLAALCTSTCRIPNMSAYLTRLQNVLFTKIFLRSLFILTSIAKCSADQAYKNTSMIIVKNINIYKTLHFVKIINFLSVSRPTKTLLPLHTIRTLLCITLLSAVLLELCESIFTSFSLSSILTVIAVLCCWILHRETEIRDGFGTAVSGGGFMIISLSRAWKLLYLYRCIYNIIVL